MEIRWKALLRGFSAGFLKPFGKIKILGKKDDFAADIQKPASYPTQDVVSMAEPPLFSTAKSGLFANSNSVGKLKKLKNRLLF